LRGIGSECTVPPASDPDGRRIDRPEVAALGADPSLIWRYRSFKDGGHTRDPLPEGRLIDSVDIETKTVSSQHVVLDRHASQPQAEPSRILRTYCS